MTTPSLSSRLQRDVMLPLAAAWAIGAAIAVWVGDEFTQQAFDSALLDDAYAVSANVRQQDDVLDLGLTDDALDAVLFDQSELMYFAVLRSDGSLLAGRAGLRNAAPPPAGTDHGFSNVTIDGQTLRAVRLQHRDAPGYTVIIAQTTANRSRLIRSLLLYAIAPQLPLLLLASWGLRRTIRRDLAPLAALQQSLDERDASDLTQVPPALIRHASSREVERLGMAIDALLGRVSDSVRAQREFAGNVAHELRTPLAGIRALAEYGLAQTDPQTQREQLAAIARSQERASHLVDQLLALALADEARNSLVLTPIALDEVARDVVLQLLPRADAVGTDLGAHGLEQRVVVAGNAALIEGMLINLIDNALRYGHSPDGAAPVVTVALTRQGTDACLSVVDNGPSVPPDARRSLLQRWAQGSKGERLGEGAGLGLAIVARYAELQRTRFVLADGPAGAGLRASIVFSAVSG